MASAAKFALRPDPEDPGLQTIMIDRRGVWMVVRLGKYTPAENDSQIARLAKRGISVERRKP